ncbi:hypothetical protein [Limnoraphis robusta]|uniref:Glycosyltransferase RgtA/B/C/D-like domain-containing protein n=1 Tax=Limnoraphis robusta CCNP1315 TaxID=3110306 RepID=A0ABU5U765_9CYAN|nr:hypothetical protein [Limnoraphis robusta]MEA5523055.1 hypothetical protein [Limnoraphis robusta CCNP1315]MEA5548732.1 hypothetical protein [Limnoraphis robusta CCNP1324]
MFDRKNDSKPPLAWVVCITLVSWIVLVPIVNSIQIPLGNKTEVISLAYLENISPYTDYLKYLILLLVPPMIAVLALRIKGKTIESFFQGILSIAKNRRVWVIATGLLLTAWVINVPFDQFKVKETLIDSFHEGEYLGFLPNFMQLEKPFVNTVLIHGWGMDVLPTWLATQFIFNNNGIALTRLFANLENVITSLGYFWIFWELTAAAKLKKSRLPLFLASCLLFCILDGIFFKYDGRRGTFFILQLALTLRFFRVIDIQPKQAQILGFVLGASIPASFLYVYDRAIYFVAVYLFSLGLSLFLEKKTAITLFYSSGVGAISSLILMTALLGIEQINAIISQVLYWGKYGRYISFIPLPPIEMTFISQNFWLAMLIQALVIVYLWLDLITENLKFRLFVQKNFWILLLLSASVVYMRITLDRSDLGHAYQGAIPTVFLLAYLIYIGYRQYLQPQLDELKLNSIHQIIIIIILLGLISSEPGFNFKTAVNKTVKLPSRLAFSDEQILQPDYLEALTVMQPEIQQQSCFYTLTSEGLWYYLFDKPSCSKYGYTLYSKPIEAQKEVIQELEETQPDIILLTNAMWYQNPWDGVLKSDSSALIYQNILQKYRPDKLIQSHWFWKRSDRPLTLIETNPNINTLNGFVEVLPNQVISRNDVVELSGWAVLPEKQKPADAVYLSYGDQNQLIAVGKVNQNRSDVAKVLSVINYSNSGWLIRVPITALPLGNTVLKVWAYDGETDQLTQIGSEIPVEVTR